MAAPTAMPAPSLRSDELTVAQYRTISWSAVIAVILGLASAVALVSPIFSPVAVAAVVVAILALRQIAASEGQLIGRAVAISGLCLATLFFGWGVGRYLTRQWALEENARRTADVWFQLIQSGRLREAYQFRLPAAARIMSPEALAEHYTQNQDAAQELAQFLANPLINELVSLKDRANVRYEGARSTRNGLVDRMVLKYTYERPAAPDHRQPMWIHLTRQTDENSRRPEWEIEASQTLPPAGQEE